jgi:hypothetical protein
MALFKRGKVWYTRFRVDGKQILRSCGTTDLEKAQQIEAQFKKWFILERHNDDDTDIL